MLLCLSATRCNTTSMSLEKCFPWLIWFDLILTASDQALFFTISFLSDCLIVPLLHESKIMIWLRNKLYDCFTIYHLLRGLGPRLHRIIFGAKQKSMEWTMNTTRFDYKEKCTMKHDYHCHSHSSNCLRNLPCCHGDGHALRNAGELTVGMFKLTFTNWHSTMTPPRTRTYPSKPRSQKTCTGQLIMFSPVSCVWLKKI